MKWWIKLWSTKQCTCRFEKKTLKRFIAANHESVSNIVFWPDKSSAPYSSAPSVAEGLNWENFRLKNCKSASSPNWKFFGNFGNESLRERLVRKKKDWIRKNISALFPIFTVACVSKLVSKLQEKSPRRRWFTSHLVFNLNDLEAIIATWKSTYNNRMANFETAS